MCRQLRTTLHHNQYSYYLHTTMTPSKNEKHSKKSNTRTRLRKHRDSDSESDIFDDEDEYETMSETDSTYTPPKKQKSRRIITSDDDESGEEISGEEFNKQEFRKTLSKIFPSKYMSKKVNDEESSKVNKSTKSGKSGKSDKSGKSGKSDKSYRPKKPTKLSKFKPKSSKKTKYVEESESESEEEEESDASASEEEESDEEEDEESDEEEEDTKKGKNVNIVFTIGGGGGEFEDEDYDEEYESDEDEEEEEEDDEEACNSDDEKTFMKEKYERVEMPKEDVSESSPKKSKKDKVVEPVVEPDIETEYVELQELRKHLVEKLHKKPNSKILKNAIEECKEAIRELIITARKKNTKTYYKLIHGERKKQSELDYFRKNLSNSEQQTIVKQMKEINNHINIEKPYRLALLQSQIPAKFKATAMQKLNMLKMMEPGESEYYKIKSWVDTFMKIPFGIHKSLSIKMDDGIEKCHEFMGNAKSILDNCVYGLDDAKMQIMQMVGQWIANPSAMGTAIAIKGPPGTGKTSLIRDGISKILGREFAFIALGGAGDSSFLEGHSYTYEGSTWGKIVQILIDSKCMNPVIYFDELDKISETPRGEEIVGILTHLTDTSQNSQFHDKYFSELDFDLSKCLFIFSYNDESRVNPILKDRMYRIQTKGYDAKEKVTIAKNYMLPKIREQVNFAEGDVIIPDDTIQYIAGNEFLTKGEAGVRNLKRCLEIIHTKLNLFRLMKTGDNIFSKDIDLKVEFPFTVTRKVVDIFIKNEEHQNQSMLAMYC